MRVPPAYNCRVRRLVGTGAVHSSGFVGDGVNPVIAALAGNAQLLQAFVRTHCHAHLFRRRYSTPLGTATIAEHRDIAAAITAGDASLAHATMTTHLRQARQRLT